MKINEENFLTARALSVFQGIQPYLINRSKILDLGAGSCHVTRLLRKKGFKVTPVDIKNHSLISDIKPIIYNGTNLPFKDNCFDYAILIDILHHCPDPEVVIKEAKRVAKDLIITEAIFTNHRQKYLTFLMDSFLNREFFGHPHTNKTDQQWKTVFKEFNLKLKAAEYHNFWKFFLSATYYLEK